MNRGMAMNFTRRAGMEKLERQKSVIAQPKEIKKEVKIEKIEKKAEKKKKSILSKLIGK